MGRRGVRVRRYRSGLEAIEIQFHYRGVQCKPILKGLTPTKSNLKYAENLKAEIDRKIADGSFRYSDYFPDADKAKLFGHAPSTLTVRDLLASWLSNAERVYAPSTYRRYKRSCDAYWLPLLGNIRATDLTAARIREEITQRDQKIKSIRNDLTPLRHALDQALTDGVISANPLDKIKVAKLVSRDQQKSDYNVDPFSESEIWRIVEGAAKAYDDGTANAIQYRFFTGVRTGEFFATAWSSIDLRSRTQKIDKSIVLAEEKEPKTAAGVRTIQLVPLACDALRAQRAWTNIRSRAVFLSPKTDKPYRTYNEWEKIWRHVLTLAQVRYRNPYQARHTYASHLLSGGENPWFVANQMGHKNVEMVMKIYGRWIKQGSQRHNFVSTFGQNNR